MPPSSKNAGTVDIQACASGSHTVIGAVEFKCIAKSAPVFQTGGLRAYRVAIATGIAALVPDPVVKMPTTSVWRFRQREPGPSSCE